MRPRYIQTKPNDLTCSVVVEALMYSGPFEEEAEKIYDELLELYCSEKPVLLEGVKSSYLCSSVKPFFVYVAIEDISKEKVKDIMDGHVTEYRVLLKGEIVK